MGNGASSPAIRGGKSACPSGPQPPPSSGSKAEADTPAADSGGHDRVTCRSAPPSAHLSIHWRATERKHGNEELRVPAVDRSRLTGVDESPTVSRPSRFTLRRS